MHKGGPTGPVPSPEQEAEQAGPEVDLNDFFTYSRVLPVPDDLPISGDFLRDAKFSCIQGIAPNLAPIWKGGASSTPTQQISQLAEQPTVDSCDSRPSPCNSYPFPPPPNPSPTPSLLTALTGCRVRSVDLVAAYLQGDFLDGEVVYCHAAHGYPKYDEHGEPMIVP